MNPQKSIQCLLLLLWLFAFSNSEAQDAVASKKSTFVIDVARKVTFSFNQEDKTYKIGVYGTGRELKDFTFALEAIAKSGAKVHGKPLEIFHFKRMKQVEPVELLYVSGDSKIRISSFNEQMENHPYFLVTENFPFGASNFNMTMNKDDEILYEMNYNALREKGFKLSDDLVNSKNRVLNEKQWKEKLVRAEKLVEKVEEESEIQKGIVREQTDTIAKQKVEMKKQGEVLELKEQMIDSQRKFLLLACAFTLIASALTFVLFKLYTERNRISEELKYKNEHIISSINYAKRIQNSTLPAKNLFSLFLPESFILFKPKDIISGDFYWLEAEGDKVFFAVADCTGHGVPGAMISVMCSNLLSKAVRELNLREPNEILDQAVLLLEDTFVKSSEEMNDGMDISLCSYDIQTKELKYAGAYGSLNLITKNGLETIKGDRQPVGNHVVRKPFTNHTLQIEKGDCLYLSSDGYADQFGGPKNRKFMVKAFRKLLFDIHRKSMSEQEKELNDMFEYWKGKHSQIDDVCVMGIRF